MADVPRRSGRWRVSAEKARQGEIILRTPLQRAIFIAGLIGAVVLAAAVASLWL